MGYKRGFKSEAKGITAEVRAELGLTAYDRLDPFQLADHLEIPVLGLSDLALDAPRVRHLLDVEPEVFSAVTVFAGSRRTIVHNDAHAPTRQASNLAHELAHGLLLHPPTPALDNKGCRHWNQDIEDEAAWLGGALLIPEKAALAIAQGRWSIGTGARHFGVSTRMVQYRVNATGAAKRVKRAFAARKRR